MLEYDKIDISKGIDINKTNESKEYMLCHYWYFLNKSFSYGPYLCDGCYNIVQKSISFKNIAIVRVKKIVYRIYFQDINKREVKKSMANSNLFDKKVFYKKILFIFSLYKKWIIKLIIKEAEKRY